MQAKLQALADKPQPHVSFRQPNFTEDSTCTPATTAESKKDSEQSKMLSFVQFCKTDITAHPVRFCVSRERNRTSMNTFVWVAHGSTVRWPIAIRYPALRNPKAPFRVQSFTSQHRACAAHLHLRHHVRSSNNRSTPRHNAMTPCHTPQHNVINGHTYITPQYTPNSQPVRSAWAGSAGFPLFITTYGRRSAPRYTHACAITTY